MIRTVCRLIGLAFMGLAVPCGAHHSFAMFDMTKTLTLQGTVKQFQWTSPHCFIQLQVASPDGPVEWSLEMNSPGASVREGWKHGSLKPGDRATVVINPARDGTHGGRVVRATDGDGRPLHRISGRSLNNVGEQP